MAVKPIQSVAGKTYTLGARCFHLTVKFARTVRHYGAAYALKRTAEKLLLSRSREKRMNRDYQAWIRGNEPGPEQLRALRDANSRRMSQPRISILTPVYNPAPAHLAECLESVRTQAHDNWEHCLADGARGGPRSADFLKIARNVDRASR